jgi:hypothetical protein
MCSHGLKDTGVNDQPRRNNPATRQRCAKSRSGRSDSRSPPSRSILLHRAGHGLRFIAFAYATDLLKRCNNALNFRQPLGSSFRKAAQARPGKTVGRIGLSCCRQRFEARQQEVGQPGRRLLPTDGCISTCLYPDSPLSSIVDTEMLLGFRTHHPRRPRSDACVIISH